MIKAILIDDEKHCNETLEMDLARYCPNVQVLGSFTSGKEGLVAINAQKPDLVFLDIEMPWMNGFEVLQQAENLDFNVIFITAYDTYAIQAFRYSAIDYLLKPIQHELLIEAINKVKIKSNSTLPLEKLETLLHNMNNTNEHNKVVFSTSEGLEIVEMQKIIRCQADSNYTHIHLTDSDSILLSKPLKEVEQMLQAPYFSRVHQSHLVNINFVKRFVKSDGGFLLLKDNTEISVSRGKRLQVIDLLGSL